MIPDKNFKKSKFDKIQNKRKVRKTIKEDEERKATVVNWPSLLSSTHAKSTHVTVNDSASTTTWVVSTPSDNTI